jgi:hypothetical protein
MKLRIMQFYAASCYPNKRNLFLIMPKIYPDLTNKTAAKINFKFMQRSLQLLVNSYKYYIQNALKLQNIRVTKYSGDPYDTPVQNEESRSRLSIN